MYSTQLRNVKKRFTEPLFQVPVDFAVEQYVEVETPAGVVIVHETFDEGTNSIELDAGDRTLSVSMPTVLIPEFSTLILAKSDGSERVPGATTALYTRGDELMQDATTIYGHAILYTLATYNPKMIEWANTHGSTIFGWESLVPNTFAQKMFGAKLYEP